MKILVVIDMQNDFIRGSLSNPVAEAIVPKIKERIEAARENKEMVVFTQDTHDTDYLETLEGQKLPVEHCIYGTEGWEIVDELKDEAALCVLKPTFMGFDLISRIETVSAAMNESVEIEVCGTVTSICVISTALMLRGAFRNSKIVVNSNLCADITQESHAAALTVMKNCQIDVIE